MKHRDHVAQRGVKDDNFRAAREELRGQYEFRRALIGARIAAGLTQKQLADKLGTTQSAVARLESGTQMPTLDTLYRLAVVLGVDFSITAQEPLSAHPYVSA